MSDPIAGEYDVFISYARADHKWAQLLAEMLEAAGYSVWWDRDMLGGHDFAAELEKKVLLARRVVGLISPRSIASQWCHGEMWLASNKPGKLIPIIIEGCELPTHLSRINAITAVGDIALSKDQILAALGIMPSSVHRRPASTRLSDDDIFLEPLPAWATRLLGRDAEMTTLLSAWGSGDEGADPDAKTNVVVLHAIGGAGKSALLDAFLDALRAKGWPGVGKVFVWSAYSQGSDENRGADADAFVSHALKFFGHDTAVRPIADPVERGRALARLVRRHRSLLVLDGVEQLQDLPYVNEGRLKDRALQALVSGLARENPGLLVITSRQQLPELAGHASPQVIDHALDELDEQAGVELLTSLGVYGRSADLKAAVNELGGHALSVTLLGTYLSAVCGGDVARRDTMRLGELADAAARELGDRCGRRAQRIIDAYLKRFAELEADEGRADLERMILSLVALFDRPAEPAAIGAVLASPPIPGLTEGWHALSPHGRYIRWSYAVKRLRALKLLGGSSPPTLGGSNGKTCEHNQLLDGAPASTLEPADGLEEARTLGHERLDAHPLVRQHLGGRLRALNGDAYRMAHSRLYDHYSALPQRLFGKALPDTLDEMQPLLFAVAHGCAAGRYEEAFTDVFYGRILRGSGYAVHQLGAVNAVLGALAAFFETPWSRPHPGLTADAQALALNIAGFALRALGRLREAIEPIRTNVRRNAESASPSPRTWQEAAINAANLAEVLETVGELEQAIAAGRESVAYADRSGDAHWRAASRAVLADALTQAGHLAEAEALFVEAEQMQAAQEPEFRWLYAVAGHRFCNLLLALGRRGEVETRASTTLGWAQANDLGLLARALDTLSLGRAAGAGSDRQRARGLLDAAVEGLRAAGQEQYLPSGLIARASFRRETAGRDDAGTFAAAEEDLAEALDIARRGGMRLHLADCQLERARLLLAQLPQPRLARDWLGRKRTVMPALGPQQILMRQEAERVWISAAELVREIGYRVREGDVAEIRRALDRL